MTEYEKAHIPVLGPYQSQPKMPSAGIVYEGVLANRAPNGNDNKTNQYEGSLFNGIKFWISQRVPDRKSLKDSLKVCVGGYFCLRA